MNPSPAEDSQADLGSISHAGANGVYPAPPVADVTARRADIDSKQQMVGRLLQAAGAEAVLLLMPAHVTWFTGGMNVRGLVADSERPGVYTNGQQRWLLCSNVDTHR
ncbi:MAG: hypothetical protein K2X87_06190, partial [Gemmataceae bacterium]|nr:hypothetical protein [Gemmataceae bacterium]